MALQVWLPLNGGLQNNGISSAIITNNGATINANGKIGQCYSFDGSDDYIDINSTALYNIFKGGSQQFTIAFWVYHNDATRAIIFGDYGLSGAIGFNVELTTSHGVRFYWNGSPDKNFNSTSAVDASVWTHIAITYNGSVVSIYKNGVKSTDTYNGTLAAKNKTTGSFQLGRASRTGTTVLNGKLNDFRIYDEALSAKQIKEISKGLILHYQLDGFLLEPTTNLIAAISAGGRMTVVDNVATRAAADAADTYCYLDLTEDIVVGDTYTLSCIVSGLATPNDYITFQWDNQVNYGFTMHNGFNSFTFIMPTLSRNDRHILFDDNSSKCSSRANTYQVGFSLSQFQLEKKDHATMFAGYGKTRSTDTVHDTSGYSHNGIIVNGSLTANNITPRYNNCTNFDGTVYIKESNQNYNVMTVSLWVCFTTISSSQNIIFVNSKQKQGLGLLSSNTSERLCCSSGIAAGCVNVSDITVNTWHHFVIVSPNGIDAATRTVYIDGVLRQPGASTNHWNPPTGGYLEIGKRSSSNDGFKGKISDFRMYATALSAADVKELYETSMEVDASGNITPRILTT